MHISAWAEERKNESIIQKGREIQFVTSHSEKDLAVPRKPLGMHTVLCTGPYRHAKQLGTPLKKQQSVYLLKPEKGLEMLDF